MAHRFNCITNDDWGGLVEAWESDVKKLQEKRDKDNKEEKRLEMNMEELIRFVTVSDTNEP